jgi:hypothetical protein
VKSLAKEQAAPASWCSITRFRTPDSTRPFSALVLVQYLEEAGAVDAASAVGNDEDDVRLLKV